MCSLLHMCVHFALAIELALSGQKQRTVTLEKKLKSIAMPKDWKSQVCKIPKSTIKQVFKN